MISFCFLQVYYLLIDRCLLFTLRPPLCSASKIFITPMKEEIVEPLLILFSYSYSYNFKSFLFLLYHILKLENKQDSFILFSNHYRITSSKLKCKRNGEKQGSLISLEDEQLKSKSIQLRTKQKNFFFFFF